MKFADPTNDITLKEYDEINALETAEKKGVRKGLRKGIEKVALTMLKENAEVELIMKFTGLSKLQLNELKIKNNL